MVHSHHPFLLGDTALRVAASREVPIDLTTGYCNLCDAVIAPSKSVKDLLLRRGITVPVTVIPTGVDPKVFEGADGSAYRRAAGIPESAFVVGHAGRLAPEKNVDFLADAVAGFVERHAGGRFLLVGEGASRERILAAFAGRGLTERVHLGGVLQGNDLASSYNAMDVFAFASLTETQE